VNVRLRTFHTLNLYGDRFQIQAPAILPPLKIRTRLLLYDWCSTL